MNSCFADNFEDDFGGPATPEGMKKALAQPAAVHIETCPKCRGTGRFVSYSGRQLGECFACKGKGSKAFKSNAADRAQNRAKAADRKAAGAQGHLDAFAAQHPREWAWIEASRATFGFAQSMHDAIAKYEGLTDNQLAACTRAVDKREAAQAQRSAAVEAAPVIDMSKIEAAFAAASVHMKAPKLRLAGLVISRAKSTSANAGGLYVKARGQDGIYLGKILGGKFMRSRECDDAAQAEVIATATNPLAAAIAYGRLTGQCSCCGRELTNHVSIERGIGPICAERYGWS